MVDSTYALLDSGEGRKLEQWGPWRLIRPSSNALWEPQYPSLWSTAHATFSRSPVPRWEGRDRLPRRWKVCCSGLEFVVEPTDFGHLGLFPEQIPLWEWSARQLSMGKERLGRAPRLLHLFAYSGGATLASARAGAEVCHVDASQPMITWARENCTNNELQSAPIRWICEDALKFLRREERRGHTYDAVLLDPPSFGRGTQGEVFKIERELLPLLKLCKALLSPNPLFLLLSSHTPGFTPLVLHHLLTQLLSEKGGVFASGELTLDGPETLPLPSGWFAHWSNL